MIPSMSSAPPLDAIAAIALRRGRTLSGIVQDELERMIVSGELKAGERLNEQAIAARLGVSRGPVREASRALENAGLLTSVANLGTFVRQVTPKEAGEIYDVRAVVFGFICAALAGRVTPEQNAALADFVARMDEAIGRGDNAAYFALNLEFHDAIVAFADHERARQVYETLVRESQLTRQLALDTDVRMRESNAEHARIVAAIAACDGEEARRLGEAHAQGGKRRWMEARDDHERS